MESGAGAGAGGRGSLTPKPHLARRVIAGADRSPALDNLGRSEAAGAALQPFTLHERVGAGEACGL